MTYTATLETPIGTGVRPMKCTRLEVRVETVTVLGPVAFEPSMLRVRRADGSVIRTMREYIR